MRRLIYLKLTIKHNLFEQFTQISKWFGDYAKTCLVDSKQLLLKADDDRMLRKK